eukprot:scaffold759_cov290-Alexandrium_tamarense.AAC.12
MDPCRCREQNRKVCYKVGEEVQPLQRDGRSILNDYVFVKAPPVWCKRIWLHGCLPVLAVWFSRSHPSRRRS